MVISLARSEEKSEIKKYDSHIESNKRKRQIKSTFN